MQVVPLAIDQVTADLVAMRDLHMRRVFDAMSLRHSAPGTLNCLFCGGKNLHYANCPDRGAETYACSATLHSPTTESA